MAKCGGCGKFMSTTAECIRCSKCTGAYHNICVGITTAAKVSPNWLCPGCKAKIPRADNSATPVKGPSDGSTDTPVATSQLTTTTNNQTSNQTNNPTNDPTNDVPTTKPLDVAYEIRCFREEMSAMRAELRVLVDVMADLKADVTSCKERVDTVESRMSNLEKRFDEKVPTSYDHVEETIAELKLQLNDRDQELLQNDVIITGIPW